MSERLPTELWVTAHLRRLMAEGLPAYVVHKGAPASGTVMVKIVMQGAGCRLFNQARDSEGNMGWMDIYESKTVDETAADQYIQRSIARDPDIWVVEVEDKSGKNPFEGKIF